MAPSTLFARLSLLGSVVAACASPGGSGSERAESAKKSIACDPSTHPCGGDETCIDGTCRPKGCSSDADCSGGACLEGWCFARQCTENLGCLGDDGVGGTADDRSCVGGVCLPMSCPRDGDRCPAPGKERCTWSSDCGFGRICYGATCVLARCAHDKDCGARLCNSGLCFDPECGDHKSCRAGQSCVHGLCLAGAAPR